MPLLLYQKPQQPTNKQTMLAQQPKKANKSYKEFRLTGLTINLNFTTINQTTIKSNKHRRDKSAMASVRTGLTLHSFWYRGDDMAILWSRCKKTTTFCRDVRTTAIILTLPAHDCQRLRARILSSTRSHALAYPPPPAERNATSPDKHVPHTHSLA